MTLLLLPRLLSIALLFDAVTPLPAATTWSQSDPFWDRVAEAETASNAGDWLLAGERYGRAYDLLPPREQVSATGDDVVEQAVRVYRQAYFDSADLIALRSARDLLDRHIAQVQALAPERDVQRFQSQLVAIDKLLPSSPAATLPAKPEPGSTPPRPATADVRAPVSDSDVAPEPSRPAAAPRDRAAPPRRRLAVGLTVGGALGLAGGVTLLAIGAKNYLDVSDDFDARRDEYPTRCDPYEGSLCALRAWRDDQRTRDHALLGTGAAVAGLGTAALIAGIVLWAREPARAARLPVLAPQLGRAHAGLLVTGRLPAFTR